MFADSVYSEVYGLAWLLALREQYNSMAAVPQTKVKVISSDAEFKTELGVAGDTLVVVKFTATW